MSAHGRRRPGLEPVGLAQLGWALLVVGAALIGGLAAATLVHASLTVAVIVSLFAGAIAVLVAFRLPARPPEPESGEPEDQDFGRHRATVRRAAPPLSRDPQAASGGGPALPGCGGSGSS